MTTTTRRTLLTAALAAPAAAVAVPLATAAPAAAASLDGCQTVVDWQAITPAGGITTEVSSPLQARVIRLAGTEILQLRGVVTCNFYGDTDIGTLPAGIRPPKPTRGMASRNNHQGINVIRVDANTSGLIRVYGSQDSTNLIRWIQLDSFSAVMS